jgi:predicted hydrocarbon binding protein
MKGIIFNLLEEMIVEQFDMLVWNDLLAKHAPLDRVYISAKNYPETELFAIATDVADLLDVTLQEVVKTFGHYLFSGLANNHTAVMERFTDFTSLVMGIHNIIHVEVNKLYHEPSLPTIVSTLLETDHIELKYHSPRKLCFCAEGLIFGAAEYYHQKISVKHDTCMHHGAEQCILNIELHND